MRALVFFLFLFTCLSLGAQDSLRFVVSNRVDIAADKSKKHILQLYKNYMHSSPDSIYDNPYWNKAEKNAYYRFDLSISSIFNGVNFEMLRTYFDFYVMSIESMNDSTYALRVMIQMKGGLNNGSSVWCIHKVSAIKEDGVWVLQNNLVNETVDWNAESAGVLTYRYSPDYVLNDSLVNEASVFVKELRTKLRLQQEDNLNYYLASDVDELGRLKGFDYFFSGITTGFTSTADAYIMTTVGEFHAHELVHLLLRSDTQRSFLIEEGLAEFLGAKQQYPDRYFASLQELKQHVLESDDYSIEKLLEQSVPYEGFQYAYPFGALICEFVYHEKGIEGIRKLAFSDTQSDDELILTTANIIGVASGALPKRIMDFLIMQDYTFSN